jgi:hypothetical protein
MVAVERQDAPYRAFILALHRHVRASGAQPDLRAGAPAFAYWPGLAVFGAMALVLPWTLVKTARADTVWQTVVIGLVMGTFLWQIGGFFWRNRPAAYDAAAIPEAVLPRG